MKSKKFHLDYRKTDLETKYIFYKVPEFIFTEHFSTLSPKAVLLYSSMRYESFSKGAKSDVHGHIYIDYSVKMICDSFHCSASNSLIHTRSIAQKIILNEHICHMEDTLL